MIGTRSALVGSVFVAMSSIACSGASEDASQQEMAIVSDVPCTIDRGAFVSTADLNAEGELSVSCPGARGITINGQKVARQGSTFTIKPHEGVNVLHAEDGDPAAPRTTDIPFLFGTFRDASASIPAAAVIRLGAPAMSSGPNLQLPLPAGPTPLNVSQIASQLLRDQGNMLGRFDGASKDVSALGFRAGVKVVRSSYDDRNVRVVVSPRARGVHVDATISKVETLVAWEAGVAGANLHDTIGASIARVRVQADVDLSYENGKIAARLGATDLKVEGLNVDSAAIGRIPFGLADGLENAISKGAEFLFNHLADPVLETFQDVLPQLAVGLEQFKLPGRVDVPFLGGSVDLKQRLDAASFEANGLSLSLAASITAPPEKKSLSAPGWLTQNSGPASFVGDNPVGASISLDYVNQALFSVWKQGLLNREISGPVNQFGISTDAIVSDAKLPPVLFPNATGDGFSINVGELELITVFHSAAAGDARVRLAVSLVAGAKLQLADGGKNLVILPSGDDAQTQLTAELIGVGKGREAAAAELEGILTMFKPYLQAIVTHDLALPPIAIPGVDLDMITPGFAGRKGRFDGQLRVDGAAKRVALEGRLIAE